MQQHLKIARALADLLDDKFEIAGFRFGLDPLVGIIPIAGDVLPLVTSGYFIWVGWKIGLSRHKLGFMVLNTLLDCLIGLLPICGDIGDFAYKCHRANLEIIENHIYKTPLLIQSKDRIY